MTIRKISIENLHGIGEVMRKKIKQLGIETIEDLIFYFPYRFDDFTQTVLIKDLKPSMVATLCGTIELLHNRRTWKRRIITEAIISDESGSVKVIWFNQPYLVKYFKIGDRIHLAGKTNENFFDLTVINPAHEKVLNGKETIHTARLVPVYHLTDGIGQKQFRTIVKTALDQSLSSINEWLPIEIMRNEGFMPLGSALSAIHFPENNEQLACVRRRLAFDELFSLQLFNRKLRQQLHQLSAPQMRISYKRMQQISSSLPFFLTEGQKKALKEILADMQKSVPMNRLLEGDVGSGKTIVASIAAFNAIDSGHQVALLAPTEILARQHYQTLIRLFSGFNVRVCLVMGSECFAEYGKISKKQITPKITDGSVDIIIGTHALLEENVRFHSLGLAIIDEQHRFGVKQRQQLRMKNQWDFMPHLLSMTATPIPRSLALTIYGDLDLSIIHTMPLGRKKIITKIVPMRYRAWTYEFIRKQVGRGRQAFVICPLIDPSDTFGARSVKQEYERLKKELFPDLRIGILHGKMKSSDKECVMIDMLARRVDILVSTSVVEVGVDIPNTTVMLIEGAERFGLAQLHQFRGRVGRSSYQSYCFLLPTEENHEEKERLKVFTKSTDGFELAEMDLELRGAGDVFGERQSGLPTLKIATLNDVELIKQAQQWADKLSTSIDSYPTLCERIQHIERTIHPE